MNFFQRASMTAAFFTFTFLVTGIALNSEQAMTLEHYISTHADSLLLAFFIMNLRIKLLLDDHKHFSGATDVNKFVGFLIGLHSWIFWGLASLSIDDPDRSCYLLCAAMVLSIFWLMIDIRDLSRRSHEMAAKERGLNLEWLIFNVVYIVILVIYAQGLVPPSVNRWILLVPVFVLCYDYRRSRSFEDIN